MRTSKDYAIGEPSRTPEIEASRQRFFTDPKAPENMSLEDIMRVYYNKPCRRISPDSFEAGRCARGSVLVLENEVVLVLQPEDNTTSFQRKRLRIAGAPMRRFKGLLAGSHIYTKGGTYVTVETPQHAAELRMFFGFCGLIKENAEAKGGTTPKRKFKNFRCKELWTLQCSLDPRRYAAAMESMKT